MVLLMLSNGGQKAEAQVNHGSRLSEGIGSFKFVDTGGEGKILRVWYYLPHLLTPNSPIVFVMHGVHRDADRYCRDWMPYAEQRKFLLICPEFDENQFSTHAYQRGNVVDDSGNPLPQSSWTFPILERLFDHVRALAGNSSRSYYIYGHSAGAQFVHRFVLFMPTARFRRAIAANSGWYTMPTFSGHAFPYSLKSTNLSESSLRESLSRDFVLLLGENDIDPDDPNLRKTEAAEEQGTTRFQRGENYFRTARQEAARLGVSLRWRLRTVPGAKHSDAEMTPFASQILF